jgi:hypothetical protein
MRRWNFRIRAGRLLFALHADVNPLIDEHRRAFGPEDASQLCICYKKYSFLRNVTGG